MFKDGSFRALGSTFLVLLITTAGVYSQTNDEGRLSYGSLSWSPDGKNLLFTVIHVKKDWSDYKPEKWGLYVCDLVNHGVSRIDGGVIYASFCPDGKRVAYGKYAKGNYDIWVLNLVDSKRRNISNHPAKDNAPSWSGDGERLAFNSDREGTIEVYVMRDDGSDLRRITQSDSAKSYNPDWSPENDRIVYYVEKGDRRDQIYLTDAGGSFHRNISSDEHHNYFPAWTPEGGIVYSVGTDSVYTMKADGSGKKRIPGIASYFARFSPDGRRLAYINAADQAIYLATVEQGEVKSARKIIDREALSTVTE